VFNIHAQKRDGSYGGFGHSDNDKCVFVMFRHIVLHVVLYYTYRYCVIIVVISTPLHSPNKNNCYLVNRVFTRQHVICAKYIQK